MATILTHGVVAATLGKALFPERMPARFWALAVLCAVLPDLDVIGFRLGVRYADLFGHRGFSHALLFALIAAVLVTVAAFRDERVFSRRWWGLVLFFLAAGASHGVLDAMTNGGYGVAFFAPFDRTRYFFPWQPLQVAPIGVQGMFSRWGWNVITSELLWIWLPLAVLLALSIRIRRRASQRPPLVR